LVFALPNDRIVCRNSRIGTLASTARDSSVAKRKGEQTPAPSYRVDLLIELYSLSATTKLNLSHLVIVGLNFRVFRLRRKLHPSAWDCGNNFTILYDFEFRLPLFRSQLIMTGHNLSASDCHWLARFPRD
jgi:hypothetical protein